MTLISTRRAFLAGAVASGVAAVVPGMALALSGGQASSHVEKMVDAINKVIASGKSEPAMIKDFEKILKRYGDTSYAAAYAMGNDGRRASSSQKKNFSNAFTGYLARKYGKRFREFIGGRLEVQNVKAVKNYYEVTTTAFLRGEAPFPVAFHVSDRSGKPLFFNMYIDGINMLLTERAEVGAMLDKRRGDIDAMIADLKKAG